MCSGTVLKAFIIVWLESKRTSGEGKVGEVSQITQQNQRDLTCRLRFPEPEVKTPGTYDEDGSQRNLYETKRKT